MYVHGEGLPRDDKEATKWFRKAAEQGHAQAQLKLGIAYMEGVGVPKDLVAAYAWWNLAAYNDWEKAAKYRDVIAMLMTPEQIAEAQKLSKELLKKIEANKAAKE